MAGPHQGRDFAFTGHDTFLVGRSTQAHFSLPDKDPYFSRLHFLVEVNPPLCRLLDLNSHNGTLLNGQKVASADLKDGDEIHAGTTCLRVRFQKMPGPVVQVGPSQKPAARPLAVEAATNSLYGNVITPPMGLPTIPGYQVSRELGRGGMGVVYRAIDEEDGTLVAIKTILPRVASESNTVARFLREAAILRELRHPRIVAFRAMGEHQGLLYFAMEYIEGTDAARLVKEQGLLALGRAVRLVRQVLDGLAYAHGKGFVHRDLKPGNVLVARDGTEERAWVADFGLARAYESSPLSGLTMSRVAGGTPQYMAPEQVLDFRSVKPAADQYAAAATLYYLLTGQPHFEPAATLQEHYLRLLQQEPVPLAQRRADLPPALAAVVHRGLAREPGQRFADVRVLSQALLPFADG